MLPAQNESARFCRIAGFAQRTPKSCGSASVARSPQRARASLQARAMSALANRFFLSFVLSAIFSFFPDISEPCSALEDRFDVSQIKSANMHISINFYESALTRVQRCAILTFRLVLVLAAHASPTCQTINSNT